MFDSRQDNNTNPMDSAGLFAASALPLSENDVYLMLMHVLRLPSLFE